jgi:hypothetical protein
LDIGERFLRDRRHRRDYQKSCGSCAVPQKGHETFPSRDKLMLLRVHHSENVCESLCYAQRTQSTLRYESRCDNSVHVSLHPVLRHSDSNRLSESKHSELQDL